MKKSKFSEEQIVKILAEAAKGDKKSVEVCRAHGVSQNMRPWLQSKQTALILVSTVCALLLLDFRSRGTPFPLLLTLCGTFDVLGILACLVTITFLVRKGAYSHGCVFQ